MKQINGIWWPESDKHCHRVVPKQVADVERALKYVQDREICVQAGGNVGIWPIYLSDVFEIVHSFEPEPENWNCLVRNTGEIGNIRLHNAGLGEATYSVGMDVTPENVGAHQINPDGNGIAITTIDSLDLQTCDLIVLDIEGFEPLALKGAKETLNKFKPVVVVEDKGLSERYGFIKGWADSVPGYKVAEKVHRDVILVPE